MMSFDFLYYINVESRTDRREVMEEMLSKHGVDAIRFNAITPEHPAVPPYMSQAERLTANEAACALSHFEVWKQVAKSEKGTVACILEDDVRVMTSKKISND